MFVLLRRNLTDRKDWRRMFTLTKFAPRTRRCLRCFRLSRRRAWWCHGAGFVRTNTATGAQSDSTGFRHCRAGGFVRAADGTRNVKTVSRRSKEPWLAVFQTTRDSRRTCESESFIRQGRHASSRARCSLQMSLCVARSCRLPPWRRFYSKRR